MIYERSLIVFILCLFFALEGSAQKLYLVSVGISDYPGTANDLILPVKDASAIYELYRKNKNSELVLLTDKQATRESILSKARALFQKANKQDIVILFFSGHGNPGGLVAYDNYLSNNDIRNLFSHCKASNKMVFADACYAGNLREHKRAAAPDPGNSVMLFLSSRDNEISIENPRMKNGIFTACLLRCLKGGADANRDRVITAKELFDAVSKGVQKLSDGRQHPVMWGNFDDDMPVMIWK